MKQFPILAILPLLISVSAPGARYEPSYSTEGMVASAEPLATRAGFEVLREGGNAADAAVAVGFALAVTYPSAGNLGGGGFLVYRKSSGEVFTLDYREKAPGAASADMFLNERGEPDPALSRSGPLAAGVPGSVAGMLETLSRFGSGKFNRRQIIARALRLSEEGFPITRSLHEELTEQRERLIACSSTARAYYPEGKAPEAGKIFRQPELARSLAEIAAKGAAGFYGGWVADSLASFMAASGGLITRQDLAAYKCIERLPITFRYKEYCLYGMGPPSSGGVVLGQLLGLLEPFDLKALGHNSASYVNRLAEAERLAFADRNHYLGDADFVDIPLDKLLSKEYLDRRRGQMPLDSAGRSAETLPGKPEAGETTHFCVVDRWGGAAAVTTTLNGGFGNGMVVPGAGFLLNNEMEDFTTAPGRPNMFGLVQGEANAIAPAKRMLSAMTPTIVTRRTDKDEEELFLVLGASGGPTIITTVLQVFLNSVVFGRNLREAVDAPRFHHQHLPDEIAVEKFALSRETAERLEKMGYKLREREYIGSASAIRVLSEGWFAGWADWAGAGAGTGW